MSELVLKNISKSFGAITALKDVSFSIKNGEFFVLLGPTGAGKTTTLRVIAGLEKPEHGNVILDGEVSDHLTPSDRDVAIVFQQYSLYPTMSVYDNLAFPLRAPGRRLPKDQIKKTIDDVAEKLRITHLLNRKTAQLSGGEMQRVSIGRAIVRRPRVFLMDEPLSNLDAKLRESLRAELKHLQRGEGITTLFVTHDQIEALTMADRIGVLDHGELIQVGTPDDIYDRPASTFVAKLVGTPRINLFEGTKIDSRCMINDLGIQLSHHRLAELPDEFTVGIRPEDVIISNSGEYTGEIGLNEPLGAETIIHIKCGKGEIVSMISGLSIHPVGESICFDLNQNRLHFFDRAGIRI